MSPHEDSDPANLSEASAIEKTSSVQLVLNALLQGIDRGDYTPGSRLNATDLAMSLGLSRGPVREALHILAGRGVIDLMPDRGAVMRSLSHTDLLDLWEVVEGIASVGCQRAAKAIAAGADPGAISEAFGKIVQEARESSPISFFTALNNYHGVLHACSGNRFIQESLMPLNPDYWIRFLHSSLDIMPLYGRYVDNYRRLTEAVLAGDSEGADGIWRHHARWTASLLQNTDSGQRRPRSTRQRAGSGRRSANAT